MDAEKELQQDKWSALVILLGVSGGSGLSLLNLVRSLVTDGNIWPIPS